jgi:hypothetical protein
LVYMLAGQLGGSVAVERSTVTKFVVNFPLAGEGAGNCMSN